MRALTLAALALAPGCGALQEPTVLVMGDSVLAWNRLSGRSIGHEVTTRTGLATRRAAVPGAGFLEATWADPIATQYDRGGWDWVVLNGGANDLRTACGCDTGCGPVLDALLTADGSGGAVAATVARIREDAQTRIVLLGYYPGPVGGGPFSACSDELDQLDARLALLAGRDAGIVFVDAGDAIDPGDLTLYDADRTHPSPEGSARIGRLVAAAMAVTP